MTMVLTCLTKNFTVQASDRRFTYPSTSFPPNDDSNKALIYRNHFAFAFTGLAELSSDLRTSSLSTIVWAGEQLKEKASLQEAVAYLRDQINDKFNALPTGTYPENLRFLDIVGAGFLGVEKNNPLDRHPARIVISNWMKKDRTWPTTASGPQPSFKLFYDHLPKGKSINLLVAGQPLHSSTKEHLRRKEDLTRKIVNCLKIKGGAENTGRLLTEAIQRTAAENHYVGGNVMCTFVPRTTDPNSRMMHLGGVLLDPPTNSNEPQTLSLSKDFDCFLPFPSFDLPRIIYVSRDGTPFPSYTPIYVFPGQSVQPIEVGGLSLNFTPATPEEPKTPPKYDPTC